MSTLETIGVVATVYFIVFIAHQATRAVNRRSPDESQRDAIDDDVVVAK